MIVHQVQVSGQNHGLLFTVADRDILKHSSGWLTDSLINAAQILIKKKHPLISGLQNVNFGITNSFDVQTSEFIQILHTGQGHWHVISTIGTKHPEVDVFDSKYSECSDHSKLQISSILHTQQKAIRLRYNNVQMQSGEADCGLFAIAFATALSNGVHPGTYYFDQALMRHHLLECLENGEIDNFQ